MWFFLHYSGSGSVNVLEADAAIPWQFGLQDPATPVMEGIVQFHHDLMVILLFVCTFVIYMMGRAVQHFFHTENKYPDGVVHGTVIEIVLDYRSCDYLDGDRYPFVCFALFCR